jgi:alcohol dehydrogenase class IV
MSATDAENLLIQWKGTNYQFGNNVIENAASFTDGYKRIQIFAGNNVRVNGFLDTICNVLTKNTMPEIEISDGAAPNSPITDVVRMAQQIKEYVPDLVISVGGGSVIDAVKSAIVLACLDGTMEDFFGSDLVSSKLRSASKKLTPHLAIMTASASAAHLTKYSNVTNTETFVKKLVIDPCITPFRALFDYSVTSSMNSQFTKAGVLDGIGHLTEVYFGVSERNKQFGLIEQIALTGLELLIGNIESVLSYPDNPDARRLIGLGTDLGGYAIMLGSTNGPHLNSFSLVDIMDHGIAVGILQPYYGKYFAPAIPDKIKKVCSIYKKHGYIELPCSIDNLGVDDIGMVYAKTTICFMEKNGLPSCLNHIKQFNYSHIEKMLAAAKNPQLESKLKAMPIPMIPEDIDFKMRLILESAIEGSYQNI